MNDDDIMPVGRIFFSVVTCIGIKNLRFKLY